MANEISCPQCGGMNSVGTKFCGGCGNAMQLSNACPQCSAPNAPGAKFCGGCGLNLHQANEIPADPGYVVDGEWHRAPGEFARAVSYAEMESTLKLRKTVQIPKGSIGLLLKDGKVLRDNDANPIGLLQPGRQLTMGWWKGLGDKFKGLFGGRTASEMNAFYLVDLRQIVIPLSIDVSGVAKRAEANVRVAVFAAFRGKRDGRDRADALESFVANVMMGSEVMTQDDVRRIVHPIVEAHARPAVRDWMALSEDEQRARLQQTTSELERQRTIHEQRMAELEAARESGDFNKVTGWFVFKSEKFEKDEYNQARAQLMREFADAKADVPPSGDAAGVLARALNGMSEMRDLGFSFTVDLSVAGGTRSIDIRLGKEAETPAIKRCGSERVLEATGEVCHAELPFTAKFCGKCGGEQPIEEMRGRPGDERAESREIFTADGQQVEIDVVLRIHGEAHQALNEDDDDLMGSLGSAASRLLRQINFADLSTQEGFNTLQEALTEDAERVLRSLGLRAMEVVVIDVRSKQGEWVLGARSDMAHHRTQVQLGHEWLEVGYSELELKELNNALVLKNTQSDHDFGFHQHRMANDDEYRTRVHDLEHEFRMEDSFWSDQEARESLLDRELALHRTRTARALEEDEVDRAANRTVADRTHEDAQADAVRSRELEQTDKDWSRKQDREESQFQREETREAKTYSREEEAADIQHALDQERKAGEQDIELASKLNRSKADDEDYAGRQQAEREESASDNKVRRKLEKLKAMQEMAQASKAQKQVHEQAMRDKLVDSGLSESQMLAAQATELGKAEHGAAFAEAMGKMADGKTTAAEQTQKMQQEMYERMMAEQRASSESSQDRADSQQAQMNAMMQKMMESQQALTQNTLGAQQDAHQATNEAYKAGAQQASEMSRTSMDAMSNVAQEASTSGSPRLIDGRGKKWVKGAYQAGVQDGVERSRNADSSSSKSGSDSCIECGAELGGNVFCSECGKAQG